MNFVLVRGKGFEEHFDFKSAQGKPLPPPAGKLRVVLERAGFSKEYNLLNRGLQKRLGRVNWIIPAEESKSFEFSTMYYTLYADDVELARGVLKIAVGGSN